MNPSLIFDIKRYAINDGPGVRTTVFFKGCPLHCEWCHNPESYSAQKQKLYSKEKCIGCGDCVEACEQHACVLTPEGIKTDTTLCILCGKCAEVCPTKATEMSGELRSVDEIMDVLKRDVPLMEQSAGGVTFSGGEPLMHPELLILLLDECGKMGIHRCIDTSGMSNSELLLEVAEKTELFLFDLKMMDSKQHRKFTGIPNDTILKNLRKLAETDVQIIIRIPLIKDVNDNDDNIQKTAEFIAALPGEPRIVNLLPFHNSAVKKHEKLGQIHDSRPLSEPSAQRQTRIIEIFKTNGIQASIGG
ncbi:MAG: glycyl-radical enzyme activating protein [Candidatus Marinimicrobia bacterium]|jgi:pyruvate formate lyase activating enzyme|nr:glycyl-radical enzyme activating protein [Candidatus Neomarinimicrobiota bacterium]MBT4362012.1 glycyl-radical enzyme activating protein [Candidatus Neomarinimicrobiota bacterium]MBT4713389.1 glycyl-radical enzyme activating protein [Candidatus Neomarinimicrobiota bacterium]MBT4945974.1 glycyl-radical enzyme activating protein [Candidatus Neomarinimicrobiota bacterium]MBT5269656.1 glycyl-radical enzyme activating protein [Candidatus Neomarinimicrobiota bacterium]